MVVKYGNPQSVGDRGAVAVGALECHVEGLGQRCEVVAEDGGRVVQVRSLHRGAILLVLLNIPFVQHAFVALVWHLAVGDGYNAVGAYRVGRQGYLCRRQLGDGVEVIVRRHTLQHAVVVVHPHVAHIRGIGYRHTVTAVL